LRNLTGHAQDYQGSRIEPATRFRDARSAGGGRESVVAHDRGEQKQGIRVAHSALGSFDWRNDVFVSVQLVVSVFPDYLERAGLLSDSLPSSSRSILTTHRICLSIALATKWLSLSPRGGSPQVFAGLGVTGHSLKDVETILDRHYLGGRAVLAETAIRRLERKERRTKAVNQGVNRPADRGLKER
jgi:hypothetical protein